MPRLSVCLCMAALLAASACSVAADPVPPSRKPTPVPAEERAAAVPVVGEVPAAMLDKMRADLAERRGFAASAIKIVRTEAVNWPNGALGCGKPGELYTQAIVPGYRVELEAGGKTFAYHAARQGHFRLCENEANRGMDRSSIK